MGDTLDFRRLRLTPLSDFVRGHFTGALDWRRRIDAAALPSPVSTLIVRVVCQTRLKRFEKTRLADELIAHFADGLATGSTTDDLIRRFGNERLAAKLIGRATRRNRSPFAHLMTFIVRGTLLLIALYGVVLTRFLLSKPTVRVDYVALLNEPIQRTPMQARGWPIFRRAMLALDVDTTNRRTRDTAKFLDQPIDESPGAATDYTNSNWSRVIVDATPADVAAWPKLTGWLDAHREGLATLREAAAKPTLGFILGPDGSAYDPELGWTNRPPVSNGVFSGSFISVLLPDLNAARSLTNLLAADLRYAREQNDAARVTADLEAMLGIARQLDMPIVVTRLVAIGIDAYAFEALQQTLLNNPHLLSDEQLINLAHRVGQVGGDTASSLIDFSAERMFFYDTVQRAFSDDGHGDGHLTPDGARWVSGLSGLNTDIRHLSSSALMATSGATAWLTSRRDLVKEYDRFMDVQDRQFSHPLRETTKDETIEVLHDRRLLEINQSALQTIRYRLLASLLPSLGRSAVTAERLLGQRDGLECGLALELYRRRHDGHYPATLEELVPALLPRVPADRISGDPLRYTLIDGAPVVYSVGFDRDDDGGVAARARGSIPDNNRAAIWSEPGSMHDNPVDGDWIVYDGKPASR